MFKLYLPNETYTCDKIIAWHMSCGAHPAPGAELLEGRDDERLQALQRGGVGGLGLAVGARVRRAAARRARGGEAQLQLELAELQPQRVGLGRERARPRRRRRLPRRSPRAARFSTVVFVLLCVQGEDVCGGAKVIVRCQPSGHATWWRIGLATATQDADQRARHGDGDRRCSAR